MSEIFLFFLHEVSANRILTLADLTIFQGKSFVVRFFGQKRLTLAQKSYYGNILMKNSEKFFLDKLHEHKSLKSV